MVSGAAICFSDCAPKSRRWSRSQSPGHGLEISIKFVPPVYGMSYWLRGVLGGSLAEEGLIELPVSPQPVQQDGQLPRHRHDRPFFSILAAARSDGSPQSCGDFCGYPSQRSGKLWVGTHSLARMECLDNCLILNNQIQSRSNAENGSNLTVHRRAIGESSPEEPKVFGATDSLDYVPW